MDHKLETYIEKHSSCSDLIFRDWKAFLNVLFACGGSVKEILWFVYVRIDKQRESLGGGGYVDKQNPEFMWAETTKHDKDLEQKSLTEITEHIESVINTNLPHTLIPCFLDIKA